MKHPDGTAAEFKQYYDEMSNEDKKVRLNYCSNIMQANFFLPDL